LDAPASAGAGEEAAIAAAASANEILLIGPHHIPMRPWLEYQDLRFVA
jgi:hypothetical protein